MHEDDGTFYDYVDTGIVPDNYTPPMLFSMDKTFFDIQTMLEKNKIPVVVHTANLTKNRVLAIRSMLESYGNSTTCDGRGNYFTVSPF